MDAGKQRPGVNPRPYDNTKTMRTITLILLIFMLTPSLLYSGERHPYGTYCPCKERGWYGERRPVLTEKEAVNLIKDFFRERKVIIGDIQKRRHFFRVEILNENGGLIDIIIIDRRTGRMRSIY